MKSNTQPMERHKEADTAPTENSLVPNSLLRAELAIAETCWRNAACLLRAAFDKSSTATHNFSSRFCSCPSSFSVRNSAASRSESPRRPTRRWENVANINLQLQVHYTTFKPNASALASP